MNSFPFEAWLRLAVTVYRLSPNEFWTMSVCDWMQLIEPAAAPLSAAEFSNLMDAFPDKKDQGHA